MLTSSPSSKAAGARMTRTSSIIHQRIAHGLAARSHRVRTKAQACMCLCCRTHVIRVSKLSIRNFSYNMPCAAWYVSFFDRVPQSLLAGFAPRPHLDANKKSDTSRFQSKPRPQSVREANIQNRVQMRHRLAPDLQTASEMAVASYG